MKPEIVGNYKALWGEGPIWHNDQLLYVDIEGKNIISWKPGYDETIISCNERVGTVVPKKSGDLLYAGDNGFSSINTEGVATPIIDPESHIKENRFNDGKCDPQGRFWAGTISTAKIEGTAKLYCLDTDYTLTEKYAPVTNSNGICWSIDQKTMYYIDTPKKEVLAFSFDGRSGNISNPTQLIDTKNLEGSPDGMTIDADGNLWVAFCRGSKVIQFSGTTGEKISEIDLPCPAVTAVAFGGDQLQTLFITTGQFSENEDHAGYLYAFDPGISGIPSNQFLG